MRVILLIYFVGLVPEAFLQAQFVCDKITSVFAIAQNIVASNMSAALCTSGTHASPEAYVLNNCNTPLPKTWHTGQRVMDDCKSIPYYTPVFSIISNIYDPNIAVSGILLMCIDNPAGFKIAVQLCDRVPHIVYVISSGENTNRDPNTYFTVL